MTTTKTKTAADIVPFTIDEQRRLLGLAHAHALDQLFEAQQTIAWHEAEPGRLSRHAMLRGNKGAWTDRAERAGRELARARETLASTSTLVEKIEAVFEVAEQQEVEAFAAAMSERWKAAKAADRKAGK